MRTIDRLARQLDRRLVAFGFAGGIVLQILHGVLG